MLNSIIPFYWMEMLFNRWPRISSFAPCMNKNDDADDLRVVWIFVIHSVCSKLKQFFLFQKNSTLMIRIWKTGRNILITHNTCFCCFHFYFEIFVLIYESKVEFMWACVPIFIIWIEEKHRAAQQQCNHLIEQMLRDFSEHVA